MYVYNRPAAVPAGDRLDERRLGEQGWHPEERRGAPGPLDYHYYYYCWS